MFCVAIFTWCHRTGTIACQRPGTLVVAVPSVRCLWLSHGTMYSLSDRSSRDRYSVDPKYHCIHQKCKANYCTRMPNGYADPLVWCQLHLVYAIPSISNPNKQFANSRFPPVNDMDYVDRHDHQIYTCDRPIWWPNGNHDSWAVCLSFECTTSPSFSNSNSAHHTEITNKYGFQYKYMLFDISHTYIYIWQNVHIAGGTGTPYTELI